jgi:signal transduction histidine kinase
MALESHNHPHIQIDLPATSRAPSPTQRVRDLLWGTAFAVVLAIAVGVALVLWDLRKEAFGDTERELRNLVVVLSEQTTRSIGGVDLLLTATLEWLRIEKNASGPQIHDMLKARSADAPFMKGIVIFDAQGNLSNLSPTYPPPNINSSDRDYFIALRDHPDMELFVGQPVKNRYNGNWTLHFARAIRSPSGRFAGVVLASVDPSYFERLYSDINLGPDSAISLFRTDGIRLVRHPHDEESIGASFASASLFTEHLKQADLGAYRDITLQAGVPRVFGYRRLDKYPLVVGASISEDAALASWKRSAHLIGAGTAAGIALILLLTYLATRRISEREADASAWQSEQLLLKTVFEAIPQGMSVQNRQGVPMLLNSAEVRFRAAWDRAVGLAGSQTPEGPVHDQLAALRAAELAVLDQGHTLSVELSVPGPDGSARRYRNTRVPLRDSAGAIAGQVGLTEDVTEIKLREEALTSARHMAEVARSRLEHAIEHFPGGIAMYDESDRLALWNSKFKEMYRTVEELIVVGTTVQEFNRTYMGREFGLQGEELDIQAAAGLEMLRASQEPYEYRTRDGRWYQALNAQLPAGGSLVLVLDSTLAKRKDEDLRHVQKIEAVGQLTGGVAHDFNNLLTVILGCVDLLAIRSGTDPDLARLVGMIGSAAGRGKDLTQRLLAFARRQPLEPSVLDLNQAVAGMSELLRRVLGESIDIELVRGAGLWRTMADPSQVENSLLNLAVNARDAMPDGGKLTIETGNVWLDENYAAAQAEVKAGQYVMLSVTDNGAGMKQEVIDRVFDPFFTTKEPGKGTGLGLSMVYGFVKQSGGHIKVYSEVSHGTSVKLYLPRFTGPLPAETPENPLAAEEPHGTEIVLVVEDDELVRANTIQQLQSLGYRVSAAPDAASALALLAGKGPLDLLFTDVVMPGSLNGRDLGERAAEMRPGIKILYTSGYSENVVVHHGRLDPGLSLLSKPYGRAELARKIRRLLDADPA